MGFGLPSVSERLPRNEAKGRCAMSGASIGSRRRAEEPGQIADDEARDERRGPLRAARQPARNDGGDSRSRRRDRKTIHSTKGDKSVPRHAMQPPKVSLPTDTAQHI